MRKPWPSGSSVDRGLGCQLSRGEAASLQPKGERHGEAPSVGRGDELFGVGTLLVFEPGPERIRGRLRALRNPWKDCRCRRDRFRAKLLCPFESSKPPFAYIWQVTATDVPLLPDLLLTVPFKERTNCSTILDPSPVRRHRQSVSVVRNDADPAVAPVDELDAYSAAITPIKRVLGRIGHELRNDEAQSLTTLAWGLAGVGENFAAHAQRL